MKPCILCQHFRKAPYFALKRFVDPPPGAPQELWAAAAPAPAALDAWGDRDTSAWAAAPLGLSSGGSMVNC
jgi:hypothetical protein